MRPLLAYPAGGDGAQVRVRALRRRRGRLGRRARMTEAIQTAPAERRITPWGWRAFLIAAVVIAADQLSKYWILSVVRLPERDLAYPSQRPFRVWAYLRELNWA